MLDHFSVILNIWRWGFSLLFLAHLDDLEDAQCRKGSCDIWWASTSCIKPILEILFTHTTLPLHSLQNYWGNRDRKESNPLKPWSLTNAEGINHQQRSVRVEAVRERRAKRTSSYYETCRLYRVLCNGRTCTGANRLPDNLYISGNILFLPRICRIWLTFFHT